MTEWRAIPGFEHYEVSTAGIVRPLNPRYSTGRGSTIKPWTVERHGRQSCYVSLHKDGARTKWLVHVLVALAHIGPRPPSGPDGRWDVAHKNHDALDNRLDNLEYQLHRDNIMDSFGVDAQEARERRALVDEEFAACRPTFLSDVPF